MNKFLFLLIQIANRKSITRALLDHELKKLMLRGRILDLGAGKKDLYSSIIPSESGSVYELLDQKQGSEVDFEIDSLPYPEQSFDIILLLNVLEHIYHYEHLLSEINRIKKTEGELIGFVPFLMWYHPDPHDFFRYTHESLNTILVNSGYKKISIEVVSNGPYIAAFQMVYPTLPTLLRVSFFPLFYGADILFNLVRRNASKRYALGYIFRAQ